MLQPLKSFFAAALVAGLVTTAAEGADPDDGWTILFDGTDLSAWGNGSGGAPGAGWVIEDGALTRKKRAGYLWTKERFGDFILELIPHSYNFHQNIQFIGHLFSSSFSSP